jgi:hypothetical protein
MSHHDRHPQTDEDLQPVIDQLRANRPQATPLELDAIKRRALAGRVARRQQRPMKSRILIIAMLAFGMLFSTTGAGLAITGLASDDQASVAQYGQGVKGEEVDGGDNVLPDTDVTPEGEDEGTAPDEDAGTGPDSVVQPTRQAEVNSGQQLPMTGFAAIPVLLLGVALFGGGLVMRRGSRA